MRIPAFFSTLIPSSACLGLMLLALGCSKSDPGATGSGGAESGATAPAAPAADEAVPLRLKWELGQRYVNRIEVKQAMVMSIPQRNQPMKQDATIAQEYAITPDKERELEMEYLATQLDVKMNGRPALTFDSGSDSLGNNPMTDPFHAIVGMKFRFFLDESNQVQRMEGLDNFNSLVLNKAPAQSKAMLSGMFGEETFKRMVDFSKGLPSHPVKPGDHWNSAEEVKMGPMGTMRLNMDYTFEDWEARGTSQCARFGFQGTMESLSSDAAGPMGMQMKLRNGVLSGKSWFDPQLGMFLEVHLQEGMDMDMVMQIPKVGDRGGGSQTLPARIDQQVKVKLVELGGKLL